MAPRNLNSHRKLLLLKMGDVAPPLSWMAGDYDAWFAAAFAASPQPVTLHRVRAHQREALPSPRGFDGIVTTGSSSSVTERASWMEVASAYLLKAADVGVPILGVCFGHQLLAQAFGGKVARSPWGRETGTVSITLSRAGREDPLFRDIPFHFFAQATHGDVVAHPPQGMTVLAGNAHTTVQAAAFAPHVRGVQFHPELSPSGMRALISSRARVLEAEPQAQREHGDRRVSTLWAGVRPSPGAQRVLFNFVREFC